MRLIPILIMLALATACHAASTPPRISYDLRMPDSELAAIGESWSKNSDSAPIRVDSAFVPERVARRLQRSGHKVIRFHAPHGANPLDLPKDYYFPDYCWRQSPDTVYLWWEAVLQHNPDYTGVFEIKRQGVSWQVRNLRPSEPVPADMQAVICKACLWKPKDGQPLYVYVNESPEPVVRQLTETYVKIASEPSTSTEGDWLNIFFGQMGDLTGGVRWIDQDHAFVTFILQSSQVSKHVVLIGGDDTLTWYLYRRGGEWHTVDIGIPVDDE